MNKALLILIIPFALAGCVSTQTNESMLVYINNGSVQCEEGGKSGLETAKILEDSKVTVKSTQCGHLLNVVMIMMCGAPASNINVHEIKSDNFKKSQSLGFEDVATLKQESNKGYDVSDCK